MTNLFQDIRFALRSFAKAPTFFLAAVVTLALGIGVNSAIFSVAYGVLLKPLDFPEPDRLYTLWENHSANNGPAREWTGRAVFSEWRRRATTLSGLSAVTGWGVDLTGVDAAESLAGMRVSHEYFSVLGVKPQLGRGFLPEEETAEQTPVVVLSAGLWARRFGSDPALVGRSITLSGLPYTVVGILPESFRAPLFDDAELFAPLPIAASETDFGNYFLRVITRTRPGVTRAALSADLDRVAAGLAQDQPTYLKGVGILAEPLSESITGPARLPLLALATAVALVLLIACANVANLLLTRAAARRHELSVRAALGAGRGRLVRQLLVESLLLAMAGGGLGLLLGAWGLDGIRAFAPAETPRLSELGFDRTVLGFTLLLSLVTGLVFGLAPALAASRAGAARLGSGGARGPSRGRVKSVLVASEVALGVALLAGAGFLVRTLGALNRVDPGFDVAQVAAGSVSFPQARFPDVAVGLARFDEILARLAERPEVAAAAAVSTLPLSGSQIDISFAVEGELPEPGRELGADYRAATPTYFGAMGIPVLAGRAFTSEDGPNGGPVVVVSETFAERYLGGRERALGRRMRVGNVHSEESPWRTVVGVVGGVRDNALGQAPDPEMYAPFLQRPTRRMTLVARAQGDAQAAAGAIRETVAAVDRDQPVSQLGTLAELKHRSLATNRFLVGLLLAFAALALSLAAVGIYGVVAHAVDQRQREIGIRMAIGARSGEVLRMVLSWSAGWITLGLVVGLGGAVALGRALSSLLYGVAPGDPATLTTVVVLLAAVGLVATYLPARRASRLDPVLTLKAE